MLFKVKVSFSFSFSPVGELGAAAMSAALAIGLELIRIFGEVLIIALLLKINKKLGAAYTASRVPLVDAKPYFSPELSSDDLYKLVGSIAVCLAAIGYVVYRFMEAEKSLRRCGYLDANQHFLASSGRVLQLAKAYSPDEDPVHVAARAKKEKWKRFAEYLEIGKMEKTAYSDMQFLILRKRLSHEKVARFFGLRRGICHIKGYKTAVELAEMIIKNLDKRFVVDSKLVGCISRLKWLGLPYEEQQKTVFDKNLDIPVTDRPDEIDEERSQDQANHLVEQEREARRRYLGVKEAHSYERVAKQKIRKDRSPVPPVVYSNERTEEAKVQQALPPVPIQWKPKSFAYSKKYPTAY